MDLIFTFVIECTSYFIVAYEFTHSSIHVPMTSLFEKGRSLLLRILNNNYMTKTPQEKQRNIAIAKERSLFETNI